MAGRFKGFCHFPCFQTLPPSRAPQARGEACVTVFERRSHLGPPAEGRQGPSDDDDEDDDIYEVSVCNEKAPLFVFKGFGQFLSNKILFLNTFNTKSV